MNTDPRVDAYIEKSADFARPVLEHFRKLVHQAFPAMEETIKWGVPHFEHKGIVCSMAAFKAHCAIGFHKSALIEDKQGLLERKDRTAFGSLGRITSLKDLPADKHLKAWVKAVADLNERGIKKPAPKRKPRKLDIPDWFSTAIAGNPAAKKAFDGFSYTNQKDYVEWVTEAKRAETREKRLAQALEWMAEGKPRNWKYMNC